MTTQSIVKLFRIKFDNSVLSYSDDHGNVVTDTPIGKIILIRMTKSGTIVGTVKSKEWMAVNNGIQTNFPNPLLFHTNAIVIVCFPKNTAIKISLKDSCNLYVVTEDKLQKAINTIKKVYNYVPPKIVKNEVFTDTLEDLLDCEEEVHREFTDRELYPHKYSKSINLTVLSNFMIIFAVLFAILKVTQLCILSALLSIVCAILGIIKFKTVYAQVALVVSSIFLIFTIIFVIIYNVNYLDAYEIVFIFKKINGKFNEIMKFIKFS